MNAVQFVTLIVIQHAPEPIHQCDCNLELISLDTDIRVTAVQGSAISDH